MNAFTRKEAESILMAKVAYLGNQSCRHDCQCGAAWFNSSIAETPCPYCGTLNVTDAKVPA
jgi:hypothetical protein